jgi:hypothetical protein
LEKGPRTVSIPSHSILQIGLPLLFCVHFTLYNILVG